MCLNLNWCVFVWQCHKDADALCSVASASQTTRGKSLLSGGNPEHVRHLFKTNVGFNPLSLKSPLLCVDCHTAENL